MRIDRPNRTKIIRDQPSTITNATSGRLPPGLARRGGRDTRRK